LKTFPTGKILPFSAVFPTETNLASAKSLASADFLRLYDEYFPRVYNYIRYRCANLGDGVATADDLTAATFERALTHLADFDPRRAPFGAWLFAIARNLVNSHLETERRRGCLPLEDCDHHPDGAVMPEEHLIRQETQAELLAALTHLDERERDLLSLKFAARFTNRRIAEIVGLSEANVGVIIYRALQKLRRTLG
jgi:RNA polymerase sigma factor (sigma-70 family)